MSNRTVVAALSAALTVISLAPGAARADNPVVDARKAVVAGVHHIGTAIGSIGHKKSNPEREESARRQSAYKAWFYRKYGYYPTPGQVHDWYVRSYGIDP